MAINPNGTIKKKPEMDYKICETNLKKTLGLVIKNR